MPSFTTALADLAVSGPLVQLVVGPSTSLIQSIGPQTAPAQQRLLGIVDTGASSTVLSAAMIAQLGIQPVGVIAVHTPSTTTAVICHQYQVNIYFPQSATVEDVLAIEAPMGDQGIQCLIGRDILRHGVLIYIGYSNQFTLAF